MLTHLTIKNFATVDKLEIEFQRGMSVITGETGAGKSIILGALGLALGDRADKAVVRPQAAKADICAEFDTSKIDRARNWLFENDLAEDTEAHVCILRRVINSDGRSRGYINGSPVTMANLKTLGDMMIDIHGQHEHQSLLKRSTHQRLLDDFASDPKLRNNLLSTWKQWQQNHQQLTELSQQSAEDSAQSQLLSYQLGELEELAIGDNEIEELEAEFKTLNHADDILSSAQGARDALSEGEEENLLSTLSHILGDLRELSENSPRIQAIVQLLQDAEIQLSEASAELRNFTDGFEADPQRLEQVNARLSVLHSVARKHKIAAKELPQLVTDLQNQLQRFANSDEELAKLQANDEMLRQQYLQLAKELTKQRKAGSSKLAKAVNAQLKVLGMPHASLEVSLQESSSGEPSQQGLETVEFLVSTNPGQPAKPMAKIASGGELSRISLAIQVITAQTSQTPCLVFDEVDVGIGGGVAIAVGELLRKLGERTQIFCVTHQAQVASQGHQHFFVSKTSNKKETLTAIKPLSGEEIVKEVARMLGGEEFSEESLAHAQQMVTNLG